MALANALGALGFSASVGCTAGLRGCSSRPVAAPPSPATAEVRIRFTKLGRNKFLGWYNPLRHETQLDAPAIRKWLDVGAQPSDSVMNLLRKALIVERPVGEPKKVYKQLSTKAAKELKAAKAAKIKAVLDAKKKAKAEAEKAAAAAAKAKVAADAAAAKAAAAPVKA